MHFNLLSWLYHIVPDASEGDLSHGIAIRLAPAAQTSTQQAPTISIFTVQTNTGQAVSKAEHQHTPRLTQEAAWVQQSRSEQQQRAMTLRLPFSLASQIYWDRVVSLPQRLWICLMATIDWKLYTTKYAELCFQTNYWGKVYDMRQKWGTSSNATVM